MKWCLVLAGLCLPAFSATLQGVVKAEGDRSINNAKIVVYHDFAMISVQRANSDRNGQYQLKLEPGPYRIFVLKKGYRAVSRSVTLSRSQEVVRLQHLLEPDESPSDNNMTVGLKDLLRRSNRSPYREVTGLVDEHLAAVDVPQDLSLVGKVTSHTRQRLDGEVAQVSSFEMQTRITDQITFESSLVNENNRGRLEKGDLYQIGAGVSIQMNDRLQVGFDAESIRSHDTTSAKSEVYSLNAEYGHETRAATRVNLVQSTGYGDSHVESSLTQEVRHEILERPITHELQYSQWQRDAVTSAFLGSLRTRWGLLNWLDISGVHNFLRVDEQAGHDQTQVWLHGNNRFWDERITLQSGFGVDSGDSQRHLVQDHRLTGKWGAYHLSAAYQEDSNFKPFNTNDVYGRESDRFLTPYANEAIYRDDKRAARVEMGFQLGSSLNGFVSWSQSEHEGTRLFAHQEDAFLAATRFLDRKHAYALEAPRWGGKVEVQLGRQESAGAAFDYRELAYSQTLNPFRDRSLGIMLAIQVRNQPRVPGWWLLDHLPWDPSQDNNWYEGQVRLMF